jgi:transmembrane sensor
MNDPMNAADEETSGIAPGDLRLEQAVEWFLRVRSESARVEDLPELQRWMASDPRNARAYQDVSATWNAVGAHASAPEIVVGRRDALEDARRAAQQRWRRSSRTLRWPAVTTLAASILVAIGAAILWLWMSPQAYATGLGERRTLTLQDGSVITLDARSRVRVTYDKNERVIQLERGQARFDVARDPARPFRVDAGKQTVIALGTQFNVERVGGGVLVTLIEGHVAVTGVAQVPVGEDPAGTSRSTSSEQGAGVVELTAGEGLRVKGDGQGVVVAKVDVERATAWQTGKMFFDAEPLATAAERINRYSRQQIDVDPSAADIRISGVFNAGDTHAFIEAVNAYFPVRIDRERDDEIRLTRAEP